MPFIPESFGVSMREYAVRVSHRWWFLVVSGVGGVLGLIELSVPGTSIPTWLWLLLLLGGLMAAEVIAFHEVREERDERVEEIQTRFNAIRYRFEMQALRGDVGQRFTEVGAGAKPESGYQFWFEFVNGGAETLEYEVEHMSIILNSYTAPNEAHFGSSSGIILPGRFVEFYYLFIPAPPKPEKEFPSLGTGEYSILYGHPSGGSRFRTRHRFSIGWTRVIVAGVGEKYAPVWVTMGRVLHEAASMSPGASA